MAHLKREGILLSMEEEWLEPLAQYGETQIFQPLEILIDEGQMNDRLYIVLSGLLEVFITSAGQKVQLGEMGHGECFGEISIFESSAASATVRGVTQGSLWSIDTEHLQKYMDHLPFQGCYLLLGINAQLSRRLRTVNEAIRKNNLAPRLINIRSRIKGESSNAPSVTR